MKCWRLCTSYQSRGESRGHICFLTELLQLKAIGNDDYKMIPQVEKWEEGEGEDNKLEKGNIGH